MAILVVRKYKNRRLYDTERSRHVTHEELLDLVRQGREVRIEAVGGDEDVTVETLLQVLLSQEGLARSVLTPEFVHFLIRADTGLLGRFYREVMPAAMTSFQAASTPFQAAAQPLMRAQAQAQQFAAGFPPMAGMPWPNPWAGAAGAPAAPPPPVATDPEPDSPAASQDDLAALRNQMDALQAQLAALAPAKKAKSVAPKKKKKRASPRSKKKA